MTPSEYYAQVLLDMKVTAAGETASGEDTTAVTEGYTRLHAELTERKKIWWNFDDDIPDSVGDPMIALLAHRLARKFGLPDPDRLEIRLDARDALRMLASVGKQGEETTATDAVYF